MFWNIYTGVLSFSKGHSSYTWYTLKAGYQGLYLAVLFSSIPRFLMCFLVELLIFDHFWPWDNFTHTLTNFWHCTVYLINRQSLSQILVNRLRNYGVFPEISWRRRFHGVTMPLKYKRFRSTCPLIQDQIPRLWFSFCHRSNCDNGPWKWWVAFVRFIMSGKFINFLLWHIFLSVPFWCLYIGKKHPIFRMDCSRPRCTAVLVEALCITFGKVCSVVICFCRSYGYHPMI